MAEDYIQVDQPLAALNDAVTNLISSYNSYSYYYLRL